MKQFLSIIILFIISSEMMNAQVILKNNGQLNGFKEIPQESIFIHFNSTLLLTGEYLYYKVYCFNTESNFLSDLSKIAYVELIGKNGEVIFKHKIKLENGNGNGDFFIPVTIQTGSYKIIGYTNWMQNGTVNNFFQNDVHIINPYLINQASVQTKENNSIDTINLDVSVKDKLTRNLNNESVTNNLVNLILDKQNFGKRAKVSMIIKGVDQNTIANSNLSISIRKKGSLPEPIKWNAVNYLENKKPKEYYFDSLSEPKIYLPELRGELISGKVTTTNNNISVKDIKVAVSIPGELFYFGIAKTDKFGHFYLNIDIYYSGDEVILQVLEENRQEFEVSLDKHISSDYSKISFESLKLGTNMKEEILKRSIHNQIENVYFKYKPDSILSVLPTQLFKNKKRQTYVLDDFTRFKTVRETIFEIVKDVFIRKDNNNTSVLRVHGYNFDSDTGILPLILIDGLLIQNCNILLDYNARNIEKINIFRDQFVIGPQIFQGAIVLKTNNEIIEDFKNDESIIISTIFKTQAIKNYFKQQYDATTDMASLSRLPDDRYQLLWVPKLKLSGKEVKLDFFTSDITGEFEICIEGFLEKHKPISIRKSIYVE